MQATSVRFKENARGALNDAPLQQSLGKMRSGFSSKRAAAAAALPEFEELRDQAKALKNHILDNLDYYLERFEQKVIEQGGRVHWRLTPSRRAKSCSTSAARPRRKPLPRVSRWSPRRSA